MQLLRSLDELLYEVMGWLVFFPLTLWRTLRHPLQMMEYASRELGDAEERQYDDTLSPPLFLLLALLVAHGLELAFLAGVNPIIADKRGLAGLVNDDTALLVLRLALFSLIPLVLAVSLLVGKRQAITRQALKAPFYGQCYTAAPFALLLGISSLLMQAKAPWAMLAGFALLILVIGAYFAVQVAWFRKHLRAGPLRTLAHSASGFVAGLALMVVVALLFS
ncbi:MAG TPA: hypothetical protein VI168_00615 [Croceibacterium sp.]